MKDDLEAKIHNIYIKKILWCFICVNWKYLKSVHSNFVEKKSFLYRECKVTCCCFLCIQSLEIWKTNCMLRWIRNRKVKKKLKCWIKIGGTVVTNKSQIYPHKNVCNYTVKVTFFICYSHLLKSCTRMYEDVLNILTHSVID